MTTKQEFREHLVSVGIPKFLAKRMAKLAKPMNYEGLMTDRASQCILGFTDWSGTPEGIGFWQALETYFSAKEKAGK